MLEAAAGSVPFKSNPLSGFAMFLTEAGTSEKTLFEERYGKNTRDMVLKASGITDRYFKEGSKINQSITGLSIEETKDRIKREKNPENIKALQEDQAYYEQRQSKLESNLKSLEL